MSKKYVMQKPTFPTTSEVNTQVSNSDAEKIVINNEILKGIPADTIEEILERR